MAEPTMATQRVQLKKWVRVLHVYLSLYAFLIILFFAVTGFIMNHPDWFALDSVGIRSVEAELPVPLCRSKDRLAIVEYLRDTYDLRGGVQDCDVSDETYGVTFRRAGERTDVTIDALTGKAQIELESKGVPAVLAAIHTGEHTGRFGKRTGDLAAVFLALTSISGIVLWATISMRRQTGIIWLSVSAVLVLAIAWRILL